MKTLFLDQFSEIGGAQSCLLDLLPALQERGWLAETAIPIEGAFGQSEGSFGSRLRSRNVPVHAISCGPYHSGKKAPGDFARFPLDVYRQVKAIRRLLRTGSFDLLYVNGPRILPAAAIASRGRVPVLFQAHNRISGKSSLAVAKWSLRRANGTILACSKSVAEPLQGFAPASRLHIVPNGTPDCGFRDREFQDPWRIGIIGRIAPEKGQTEFLRAAAFLTQAFPSARFVVCGGVGAAATNYHHSVQALARGLPVDFLGWKDQVAPVLRELDLLIVPSREEGMPRVVIEAFSAGVPVVAFPVGGIPEILRDDSTGFLVPGNSVEALVARITEILMMDPWRLRAVAGNARRAWERDYTVQRYRSRITSFMERAASRAEATRGTVAPLASR